MHCILTYGALTPQKNHETFIRAAALVVEREPATRFAICGEGPERKRLESIVSECSLRSRVHFLGHRSDIPFLLKHVASIVVSAGDNEGFGRIATESMAASKPVVVPRSGAFPELIRDGENGCLFNPGDCRDLADRISYLLSNPVAAKAMCREARRCFDERFHVDRFLAETIPVLEGFGISK
jgi:glycosyltransferase involved in cell wall biosynthesis